MCNWVFEKFRCCETENRRYINFCCNGKPRSGGVGDPCRDIGRHQQTRVSKDRVPDKYCYSCLEMGKGKGKGKGMGKET